MTDLLTNRETMMPKVLDLLRREHEILITSHEFADGDGIGSEIALGLGLIALGKRVRIINNESVSLRYRFLDKAGLIAAIDSNSFPSILSGTKVVVVVDNNSWPRLKHLEAHVKASDAVKVCIDHHVVYRPFSDHHLFDRNAASTGEIVYDILKALGAPIDREIATAVYTTLCTDTGWFRHSNTTRRTFELAAELVGYGIEPEAIYAEVNYKESRNVKKLLARVLDAIQVEFAGRYAWSQVSRAMRADIELDLADTENYIDHFRDIDGVKIAAIFKETRMGGIKISLRSRPPFSAHQVAKALGGGGHVHASGVTLDTTLEKAIELVRAEVAKQAV